MANTRPYTREELKGLRRANLQNLFKIHNLKGANGTNSILIDSLVEYFSSPRYLSAHPPAVSEKDRITAAPIARSQNASKSESRYKIIPTSKPVKGRVDSASIRKPIAKDLNKSTQIAQKKSMPLPVEERISISSLSDESRPSSQLSEIPQIPLSSQRSLPTPPASSSSQTHPVSFSQVETLLSANDARWQARLEALEKNLNNQMERLRIEMDKIRNQQMAESSRNYSAGSEARVGKSWSPWQDQSRAASQPLSGPSSTKSLFPALGRKRNVEQRSGSEDLDDHEKEAKRVRFNGSKPGDDTPLNEFPPTIFPIPATNPQHLDPHTPSPQKTSSFGADYFSNPSLTPLPAQSSLIPRTPSPSRQGIIPDNSQTPRLPNDWQEPIYPDDSSISALSDEDKDQDMDDSRETPVRSISMIPHFSTTPEPPSTRPISPTTGMERSVSGSSDRFTPGRLPSTTSEDRIRREQIDAPPLSSVTDLERIDEMDEHSQGQLKFPPIKPIRLSGLGTPSSSSNFKNPSSTNQRIPSLLGPPALISRNSRAESELPRPRIRVGSRGLSPPTRPRSANAIHESNRNPSISRNTFALNLPEPKEGMIERERLRSASADYMHVAMHGLEDDGLDFDDNGCQINNDDDSLELPNIIKERESKKLEMPTPRHRTLLGTERYNDKRFGDIPVEFPLGLQMGNEGGVGGIWESPNGPNRIPPESI
ncbi:uncharacterized protein I206_102248 [Kwoniella pini CBS 10737]|uniref:Uncharacterized protein n=1 Tax=Kwoniella pini CBS 10737 TaxID=1296096 RepID=A0A1B9HSZ3_9TREE|nr:uncharacterized protein I206_07618 [Kwoniella pini CBS 10737]OCF46384.1 hypothetical protein I206_07618 [Kwoniella pini CBS 10737]